LVFLVDRELVWIGERRIVGDWDVGQAQARPLLVANSKFSIIRAPYGRPF
jgi:hypothetical protein